MNSRALRFLALSIITTFSPLIEASPLSFLCAGALVTNSPMKLGKLPDELPKDLPQAVTTQILGHPIMSLSEQYRGGQNLVFFLPFAGQRLESMDLFSPEHFRPYQLLEKILRVIFPAAKYVSSGAVKPMLVSNGPITNIPSPELTELAVLSWQLMFIEKNFSPDEILIRPDLLKLKKLELQETRSRFYHEFLDAEELNTLEDLISNSVHLHIPLDMFLHHLQIHLSYQGLDRQQPDLRKRISTRMSETDPLTILKSKQY